MDQGRVLVLTAARGSGRVRGAVEALLRRQALSWSVARWLQVGDAWEADIDHREGDTCEIREEVSAALAGHPVDINVVAGGGGRRKRLLCADMESTIIEQELIDEVASLAGRREEVSRITAASVRGEIAFTPSLIERVALFEGIALSALDGIYQRATLMPGAEALLRTMKGQGATCALISGGFSVFAEPLGERLGFDAVVANTLEARDGKLTGRLAGPIIDPQGKADALRALAARHSLDPTQAAAVGDGSNDREMLATAGLGVAFRAKPVLAAAARSLDHGAIVSHCDLTAVLFLQGLSHEAPMR
jgi:phosphoserine phosphatase